MSSASFFFPPLVFNACTCDSFWDDLRSFDCSFSTLFFCFFFFPLCFSVWEVMSGRWTAEIWEALESSNYQKLVSSFYNDFVCRQWNSWNFTSLLLCMQIWERERIEEGRRGTPPVDCHPPQLSPVITTTKVRLNNSTHISHMGGRNPAASSIPLFPGLSLVGPWSGSLVLNSLPPMWDTSILAIRLNNCSPQELLMKKEASYIAWSRQGSRWALQK